MFDWLPAGKLRIWTTTIIYFGACLGVWAERSVTFSKAFGKQSDIAEGQKKSLCQRFEGKLISYIDQTSLVQNCKQRPVLDPEVLNALLASGRTSLQEVHADVYRNIPMGEPYERIDYLRKSRHGLGEFQSCKKFNNSYVTCDGSDYYYVSDCRRQFVSDFYKLQSNSSGQSVIFTISPEELESIPLGPNRENLKKSKFDIDSILYKMDDHIAWGRLYRRREPNLSQLDSPEVLGKILKKRQETVNSSEVCKKFNRKIVAFFSEVYLIKDCRKHLIPELSIELQEFAENRAGGIFEMSPEELKSLKPGEDMPSERVLQALKRSP